MKLITLEDGMPVFNPEVRTIKEFRDLLARDKSSKGDSQGKLKLIATKELAYVHFISHPNSEFVTSYSESERPAKIKKHLALPEEWKCDALVELAILTYKELIGTPSTNFLVEARESLFSAETIVKILRRRLESRLQELNSQITGVDEEETEKLIERLIDKTTKDYDQIIKMAEKMPTTLDTVLKLEQRIKKEMEVEQKGRKQETLNDFEL